MTKKIIAILSLILLFVTPIYAAELQEIGSFNNDSLRYYMVSNSDKENSKALFCNENQLTNYEFDSIYFIDNEVFPPIASKIIDGKRLYTLLDLSTFDENLNFKGIPFIYANIEHKKLYGYDIFTCTMPNGEVHYYLSNFYNYKNFDVNYSQIGELSKFESLNDVPNPYLDREPIQGLDGYYRAEQYPTRYGMDYAIVDEDYNVMASGLTNLDNKVSKGNTIMGRAGDFAYIVNPNFEVISGGTYFNHPVTLAGKTYIRTKNTDHTYFGYIDLNGNPINDSELIEQLEDIGASSWAVNSINSALDRNIIPLRLQGDYHKNITREEFCEIAMEAYISTGLVSVEALENSGVSPFTDVDNKYVTFANKLGVVNGVGEGKFNPSGEITRQEAAVMLAKLGELKGDVFIKRTTKFIDESYFAAWAKDSIYKVSGTREGFGDAVMGGTDTNKFSPWMTYTREQAITTIIRLFNMDY